MKSKIKEVPLGSHVMFVRFKAQEFEVLARGVILAVQNEILLVELTKDAVAKLPRAGDVAIPLAPPKEWGKPGTKIIDAPLVSTEPPPLPDDPGFIQFTLGTTFSGQISSSGTTDANAFKKASPYRPSLFGFQWYFEFLWHLGVEYESESVQFPTENYFHKSFVSKESVTRFSINYRTRKMLGDHLRTTFRLLTYTNDFSTENPDENLLSSLYQSQGIGIRLADEFNSVVWTTDRYQPFSFHRAYFELAYFPSVTGTDKLVQRGVSTSGSTMTEMRIGASALMYLKWMPLFKRFILDLSYFESTLQLKFNGKTTSEVGGIYAIPEGGVYTEKRNLVMLSYGLRFDDVVGAFLKPR